MARRGTFTIGALVWAWRNMNGDWVDSEGVPQGNAGFTTTRVGDANTPRWVEWDVTELISGYVTGNVPNQGIFLRATGGGGHVDFTSREGDVSRHPELLLGTSTGAVRLTPTADTYLEPSTFHPQGSEDRMRVGSRNNALLRFDLASIGDVSLATLRLWTSKQHGGGADIGVFRPAPGRRDAPPAYETGIAAPFDMDRGLANHPDVIFFADFQADDWMDGWTRHAGSFDIAEGQAEFGFDALNGRALRARILEGANAGLDAHFDFVDEMGEEPEEIYFRYYLRLGSDWNQTVDGGKLPGISGTYDTAGWGSRRSDGSNGWSARGLFRESVPAGGNPLALHTPIGSYVYHADMSGTSGDSFIWVDGWGKEGYGGVLARERWYCLEYYVRMNTPGENNGVIRAWVDGRMSLEKTDFRFRDVDRLKIERIWMNVYHGGTSSSPYDQHVFIDQVVVARRYIGPMTGVMPLSRASAAYLTARRPALIPTTPGRIPAAVPHL